MSGITYGSFPILRPPHLPAANAAPSQPLLPSGWQCTALLHPYSPPPVDDPRTTPFYQICIATIGYMEGEVFSAQLTGLEYGTWWYKITPSGTILSTDKGNTWSDVDMGWSMPSNNWLGDAAVYFNTSYLNWMQAQQVDWWKQPVPNSNATTWIWFDSVSKLPFRMMFGAPPPSPDMGDPNQLALFQNFSFTYFPSFVATNNPVVDQWSPPVIPGFVAGNPDGQKLMVWNDRFAMTTLMTPVDSASFPLPTSVLYQWKPDQQYSTATDRTQCTIMSYEYNPSAGFGAQVAMLYGAAPKAVTPPPCSGDGWLFNETIFLSQGYPYPVVWSCQNMKLGQEPPNWASIPAVEGTIHASVTNNAALCPNQTVNIISVLFPPTTEYPQGRYLWTWYSPFPGSDGTHSRPVTFMESASDISEGGTSLALADYFDYIEMPDWFPSEFFTLPPICTAPESRNVK